MKVTGLFLVFCIFISCFGKTWGEEDSLPNEIFNDGMEEEHSPNQIEAFSEEENYDSRLSAHLSLIHNLIQRGLPEPALEGLRFIAENYPNHLNILFLLGLTAVEVSYNPALSEEDRNQLLDEAASVFQTMLSKEPNLHRVHLELARIYFLQGKDSLAKKHFQQGLGESAPPAIEENINYFLTQIKNRRPWQFIIGIGMVYDSNIDRISEEDTIYIFNLPFSYEAEKQSGIGLSLKANGEYQHKMTENHSLRLGSQIDHINYSDSDYDEVTVLGYAGPRWLLNQTNEVSVLAVLRHYSKGYDFHYTDKEARIETAHQLSPRLSLSSRVSSYDRKYNNEAEQRGEKASVGLAFRLSSLIQTRLKFSKEKDYPKKSDRGWSSQSIELGFTFALPEQFILDLSKENQRVKYQGNQFPYIADDSPRKDRVSSLRLDIRHKNFEIAGGFRPQFSLTQEERKSNAQLHSYKRTMIKLGFSLSF